MNAEIIQLQKKVSATIDELNSLLDMAISHEIPIQVIVTGIPGKFFVDVNEKNSICIINCDTPSHT